MPIGDDIEPVAESRVDVTTGNEEEEAQEVEIPTLEMIQKNLTSREEQELEDCGHADYMCCLCQRSLCRETSSS